MIQVDAPTHLTAAEVVAAVRHLPGFERATVLTWACNRMTGGAGECLGVWRVHGTAETDNSIQPWSIVLKGWSVPAPGSDPADWDWSLREAEMYRSGLLDDLPGDLRAPAYFGDFEGDDGSVWLWLEDIAGDRTGSWPIERYADVARQLGQFNGAWLVDRPLPEHPFLSRDWLSKFVEPAGELIPLLMQAEDHPLMRQFYAPNVSSALIRMWDHRHASYALLRRLPQTFCHLDVFRRNIFDPPSESPTGTFTLIDWSFAGIAAIGEELAALIGGSVVFLEAPVAEIQHLEELALAAYNDGLRDAGWRGDPELARIGYRASIGLRYGVTPLRFIVPQVLAGAMSPEALEMIGHPQDEIIANSLAFHSWLAGLDIEE